jgi:hypothetical protein
MISTTTPTPTRTTTKRESVQPQEEGGRRRHHHDNHHHHYYKVTPSMIRLISFMAFLLSARMISWSVRNSTYNELIIIHEGDERQQQQRQPRAHGNSPSKKNLRGTVERMDQGLPVQNNEKNENVNTMMTDSMWEEVLRQRRLDGKWVKGLEERIGCPDHDSDDRWNEEKDPAEPDEDGYPPYVVRIPTEETWNKLFRAYHATIDPNNPTEIPSIPTLGYREEAFPFPVDIKIDPHKGRGVYATTFIPKGATVWYSGKNTAVFDNVSQFRRYLEYLLKNESRDMVCDVMIWIDVVQNSPAKDDFVLCETMDPGVLMNNASSKKKNLVEVEEEGAGEYGCLGSILIATRDILPGEGK